MKISLSLDAGFCFDYLSILQVKRDQNKIKIGEIEEISAEIQSFLENIGLKIQDILETPEYKQLYSINLQIYLQIEKIREGIRFDASIIDNLNIDRWKAKKALHSRFFDSSFSEFKSHQ